MTIRERIVDFWVLFSEKQNTPRDIMTIIPLRFVDVTLVEKVCPKTFHGLPTPGFRNVIVLSRTICF